MVSTIGGQEPALRIGMISHFRQGRLHFRASDPPPDERGHRVELPLNRERLMEGYYRPFRTFLSRSDKTIELRGERFRISHADSADLAVGLAERRMEANAPNIRDAEHQDDDQKYYVGRDGVLVILGPLWSPSNMALEPQSRTRG